MTIIETAKITSKGQVTIPNCIRKVLDVAEGASLAFAVCKEGIILFPCRYAVVSPYTSKQWKKIKKIASAKGKSPKNIRWAKKYIDNL